MNMVKKSLTIYFFFFFLLIICFVIQLKDQKMKIYLAKSFSFSNLSIIVETDFFDYHTFEKIWKPIIFDIPLYITSFYFFVHHENYFNQSKKRHKTGERKENLRKIKKIKWAKVIFSDLPENGYLPLLISSYGFDYYPPKIICYIDARNYDYKHKKSNNNNRNHLSYLFQPPDKERKSIFHTNLVQWITDSFYKHLNEPKLSSIFGFRSEITIPNNIQKIVGCDVVMTKEEIIRDLLFYTKNSMDSPSPFIALSMIDENKGYNSYDNLIINETIQKVNENTLTTQINQKFQCPELLNKKNFTFAVFIPCFKRNYFKAILSMFSKQITQPSFYLLIQNRYYVTLDVENKLSKYLKTNKRPIYKIWMINFNSFFILPNLITSLLNTDFVIRFDDDHIPLFKNITSYIVDRALKENQKNDTIIGHRSSTLNRRIYAFHDFYTIFCVKNEIDYVASPYIYRPQHMKLSGRMKPFFIAGGEDFQLSLVASIQCGTISLSANFNIEDRSNDWYMHIYDKEIDDYYNIHGFYSFPDYFSHFVYAYYIKIGYKPKCWIGFKLNKNRRINGAEYSHRSVF